MNFKRATFLTILALSLAIGSTMMLGGRKTRAAIPTCSVPGDYATIQAAVNDPGCTTINVAPGIYTEDVTINRSLTLNGAQAGQPFGGRTFGDASESKLVGTITIQAASVTVDGFSLTKSVATFAAFGIVVKSGGNDALITNNIIDGVSTLDTSSNGTAQAIYLENGPDNVGVVANKINNIQSNRSAKGVLIGSNGGADPSQNTIVQGNSITNITSDTRGAYGVSVANVINVSGLEIRDNNIKNLTGTAGWAHAIGLEGDTPNAIVEGNCISNIVAPGTDRIAVWFESNPSFSTAKVNSNNLDVTSAAFGIAVHPALVGTPLDGTNNWWGSATGPTTPSNPGGTGAKVSPNVNYTPWLIAPPLGGACGGIEATNSNQCKNNGWKTVFRANGTSFKNQGDCMQYVNTGK